MNGRFFILRAFTALCLCLLVYMMAFGVYRAIHRSKRSHTLTGFRVIAPGIGSFHVDYGHWPVYTGEWKHSIIPADLWEPDGPPIGFTTDGWGRPYWYISKDGASYTLVSYGKDGEPGCSKDVLDCDIRFVDGFLYPPTQ